MVKWKNRRKEAKMKKRLSKVVALFAALAMVMTMSVSVFAASITSTDALNAALKNCKLKKSNVKLIEIDYENDDNMYEVEFTKKKNGAEYSFEINADSGKVMEKSVEYRVKRNTSHKKIGKTAARKKVAKFLGISYKTVKAGTCYYEYDDGKGVYEVRFTKGSRNYECEVLAPTGKILEYSWKVTGI